MIYIIYTKCQHNFEWPGVLSRIKLKINKRHRLPGFLHFILFFIRQGTYIPS